MGAASVQKVLWQGCGGKLAGGQWGDVVELGQLHWLKDEVGVEVGQGGKRRERIWKGGRDARGEG